ncbi:MAG: hypothetical protein JNM40_19195 [Myxococcales bacterium]|nr:hypothetical protein [Myxococcales bacterium]
MLLHLPPSLKWLCLSDSFPTPFRLLSDSFPTPSRLLSDSFPTPVRFVDDFLSLSALGLYALFWIGNRIPK